MQPIKMVDLYSQYLHIKKEIDQAIQDVIASSVFIKGGKVNDFEKKLSDYLDSNVVACGNGTDALQLAFMALGLNPGDEVVTTPFTFVSTIEVLAFLKLKPVFVDIHPETFNINENELEKVITNKTRAILPVHLFGQCSNMEPILNIAQKHKLFVVEDAAQSLGSEYSFSDGETKQSGTMGQVGITSFFPSKNLGAMGDGGAVICKDTELANNIRSLANHGMKERYNYGQIGINSRLDAMQAAILEVKLSYLETYLSRRKEAAAQYTKLLQEIPELKLPTESSFCTHTYNQYTIQTDRRDALKDFLASHNIPTQVYYPKPLHLQEAYKFLGYKAGDFPVCKSLSAKVLSLPMHTELQKDQINYIAETIKRFFTH